MVCLWTSTNTSPTHFYLHLYFSSKCPLERESKPIFMDKTRIFPLRPLQPEEITHESRAVKSYLVLVQSFLKEYCSYCMPQQWQKIITSLERGIFDSLCVHWCTSMNVRDGVILIKFPVYPPTVFTPDRMVANSICAHMGLHKERCTLMLFRLVQHIFANLHMACLFPLYALCNSNSHFQGDRMQHADNMKMLRIYNFYKCDALYIAAYFNL